MQDPDTPKPSEGLSRSKTRRCSKQSPLKRNCKITESEPTTPCPRASSGLLPGLSSRKQELKLRASVWRHYT